MKKKIFPALGLLLLTACSDLDIPPKNIVSVNTMLSNETNIKIYMAQLYSRMPFEGFKYMGEWGFNFSSWLGAMGIEGTGEAMNRDGICRAFTGENTAYWAPAFKLLRDANIMLETLPQYRDAYVESRYNHYLGEAYFVRATVFYAMARRFGGVPLVTRVLDYATDNSVLIPRSSEEETWDQVLADYDKAIELLADSPLMRGYSSKYIALAFKSEAMLYAGCVAKYNETFPSRLTGLGAKTGVRVIGFDQATAADASKRYFTEAYKAANEVIVNGGYSLYKKKWQPGTTPAAREAQYQNMVDMFSDLESNPENMLVEEYVYPTKTHGYDAYSSPFQFRTVLAGGTCPTLDFVELFDGFPRYPDGTIRVTNGYSNTDGTYEMYDSQMAFFANAEPRLRAYVIFPCDMFKGQSIEIRGGVYTGSEPIAPLFSNYSYSTQDVKYQSLGIFTATGAGKQLYLSESSDNRNVEVPGVTNPDGSPMKAAGLNGPFYGHGESAITGFYGRKWLNPDPTFVADEGKSAQPYTLMRYGEVLLNAAEAAVELAIAGVTSPDGSNMLQVATAAVNDIRERAGATLLTGSITPDVAGRNIVRKERRKELALEGKTRWDLRRWRVNHYEGRDGFWGEVRNKNAFSDNEKYRFRGLYPFYSVASGKYFFDAHFQWVAAKEFSYREVDYYWAIPGDEVTKNAAIDQQPNR
ncbi:MAG: RagB/SusD family nutrient uptake outer membrane protein [Rikenellaceae bacterium]|jgi:hypothetical protein|nr:RagB/SusD family nutrient uptake outer membrane protein [Rikenellaceae bacterium]